MTTNLQLSSRPRRNIKPPKMFEIDWSKKEAYFEAPVSEIQKRSEKMFLKRVFDTKEDRLNFKESEMAKELEQKADIDEYDPTVDEKGEKPEKKSEDDGDDEDDDDGSSSEEDDEEYKDSDDEAKAIAEDLKELNDNSIVDDLDEEIVAVDDELGVVKTQEDIEMDKYVTEHITDEDTESENDEKFVERRRKTKKKETEIETETKSEDEESEDSEDESEADESESEEESEEEEKTETKVEAKSSPQDIAVDTPGPTAETLSAPGGPTNS